MQTVTIAQAKNQLSSLIHAAEQGEDVLLTRHGKPVVRLVAERTQHAGGNDAKREAAALAHLQLAGQKLRDKVRMADWKTLRDEGRRF